MTEQNPVDPVDPVDPVADTEEHFPKYVREVITGDQALAMNFEFLKVTEWYKELLGIYVGEYDPAKLDVRKAEESIPRSDRYTGEAIALKFRHRVSYMTDSKTWYIWNGIVHQAYVGDNIVKGIVDAYQSALDRAISEVRDHFVRLGELTKATTEDSVVGNKAVADMRKKYETIFKEHRSYRNYLNSTGGYKSVAEQLRIYLSIQPDHFSDDRDWFVVRNCVIDVQATKDARSLVLRTHDPARPVYRYMDAYYNPDAEFEVLEGFLLGSMGDASQAEYFQRAIGSAMLGAPTSTKTFLDVFGETNSGKSTITDIINTVAPDFFYAGQEPAIVRGHKDADMSRDSMRSARIIAFAEVKARLDKSFILKYTGGDTIETSRKYRNSVSWKAQGLMMVMSNEGLNIGSQEAAIAARIERVEFPHEFKKASEAPEGYPYIADGNLDRKIVANRDGFLNWLIIGFMRHLEIEGAGEEKPSPTESMKMLKIELQEDGNSLMLFWELFYGRRYVKDLSAPGTKMLPLITVIADYRKWCNDTGYVQLDSADVKAWFKRQNLVDRVGGQQRVLNIIVKEDYVYGK